MSPSLAGLLHNNRQQQQHTETLRRLACARSARSVLVFLRREGAPGGHKSVLSPAASPVRSPTNPRRSARARSARSVLVYTERKKTTTWSTYPPTVTTPLKLSGLPLSPPSLSPMGCCVFLGVVGPFLVSRTGVEEPNVGLKCLTAHQIPQGVGSWKSKSTKECVTTHLPNGDSGSI